MLKNKTKKTQHILFWLQLKLGETKEIDVTLTSNDVGADSYLSVTEQRERYTQPQRLLIVQLTINVNKKRE